MWHPQISLWSLARKIGRPGKNTSKVFACPKAVLKGTKLGGDTGHMYWTSTTSCLHIFYIGDSVCIHLVYWYDSPRNKVQSTDGARSYSKVASKYRHDNRILYK